MISAGAVGAEWSTFGAGMTIEIPEALISIGAAVEALGGGASAGVALVAAAVSLNPFADLVGFIVAVALLIIAFAVAILLLRPLGFLLGHIPLVGGAIQGALDGASNAIWNFVTSVVHNGLLMIWHLIKIIWAVTFGLPSTIAHFAGQVAGTIVWVRNDLIPFVRSEASQLAHTAEHAAEQFAANEANAVSNFAHTLFAEATATALSLYHQAVNLAQAEANAVRGEAVMLYNDARSEAVQLVHGAEAAASAGIAAAVATAEHLFGEAEREIAGAEHAAQTALESAVTSLTGLITGSIAATTLTLGRTIAQEAERSMTAERTIAQEFEDYMQRCGTPICNGLRGMADEVSGLLNLFDDAAVFALLALLLSNPRGALDVVREVFVVPAQEIATVIREAA